MRTARAPAADASPAWAQSAWGERRPPRSSRVWGGSPSPWQLGRSSGLRRTPARVTATEHSLRAFTASPAPAGFGVLRGGSFGQRGLAFGKEPCCWCRSSVLRRPGKRGWGQPGTLRPGGARHAGARRGLRDVSRPPPPRPAFSKVATASRACVHAQGAPIGKFTGRKTVREKSMFTTFPPKKVHAIMNES